ncbi:hypothetical protein SLS62_007985 [Diatrype stigma]|uniref:N-acetyltransferase domain-containing protein n=1 Tax=Diatrype stigma TaxID=117547 RepID=A0AAN9UNW9_9PEZI
MAEGAAAQKPIRAKTTLPAQPLPSNAERPHINTERLILRPFAQDDLEAYHAMRVQPEVMKYSLQGRPDRDLAESQAALDAFLPPRDTEVHNCVVALAATGELVGVGGCRLGMFMGWPEVGYTFRRECWKLGYATEFLRAFVEAWWKLPRQDVEAEVDPVFFPDSTGGNSAAASAGTGEGEGEGDDRREVPEQLVALVEVGNIGSHRVLEKCGFRRVTEWTEPDCREGSESANATLIVYAMSRPN